MLDYTMLMVNIWNISIEHKWDDNDRQKPKYTVRNLTQCHFLES